MVYNFMVGIYKTSNNKYFVMTRFNEGLPAKQTEMSLQKKIAIITQIENLNIIFLLFMVNLDICKQIMTSYFFNAFKVCLYFYIFEKIKLPNHLSKSIFSSGLTYFFGTIFLCMVKNIH